MAHAAPSAAEAALAQESFNLARQLFAAGQIHEACDKFAASQKLDPREGTLLNLAICHEKEGKTASAWLEYSDALAIARNEGRADRQRFAKEHIDRLAPQLSHLRVNVTTEARISGLAITLDGAPLQPVAWGSSLPVDPGTHTVEASAPDHVTWQKVATVGANADEQVLDVPALAATAKEAVVQDAAPTSPTSAPAASSKRTAGFIFGGVGLASLGVGATFGVLAIAQRHDAVNLCNTGSCGSAAQSANSEGLRDAWISDITLGVGIVGVAVGTYLVLTGHPTEAPKPGEETHATLAVTGRGVSFAWTFR
jgi:hypothetical protein